MLITSKHQMASLCILLPLTLILAILGGESLVTAHQVSLPGCPEKCGNMSIPYPFGTKEGCYLNPTFLITCNDTSFDPPMAFLGKSNIKVTEIMASSGELRSWVYVAHQCFNKNGRLSVEESNQHPYLYLSDFTVSSKNKFTVVGCDAFARFDYLQISKGFDLTTGCFSTCTSLEDVVNGSCSGLGCCQISVPKRGALRTRIALSSSYNHTSVWSFDRCSFAFVVEEGQYNFSSLDFERLNQVDMLPVILDWTIANQTCEHAKQNLTSYACKGNSYCYEPNDSGYKCYCTQGYQGNPYLQDDCQDIDECTAGQPCVYGKCTNFPGGYSCTCPKGHTGDGRKDGTGCTPISKSKSDRSVLITALGVSIGFSTFLLAGACLSWGLHKRKLVQLRKKYFEENGGITLQQILSQHDREIDAFKIFTAEELNKATNNFDENKVLGQGGQGTVYEGELPDKTIVAIKKSNAIDKTQVQQFVNEVVVLSQINHKNVVKLLGCCLETEVPMLVYEFITNGTLFDHIQKSHTPQLPWNTRLRIAAEIATALSYLHSATSVPIIHRDIKTTNILLDDSYTAKISDFGTSKFAPIDKTSLTTLVQGTLGYLDPEYFYSSHLTEKSDVYSFGVVLVELLTGERALNFDRKEEERSLAMYFVSSMKEDRLFELVDENLKRQVTARQLNEVAVIAAKCLNVRGEDRPTMKELATKLEGLAKAEMHPWVAINLNVDQDTAVLLHGDKAERY